MTTPLPSGKGMLLVQEPEPQVSVYGESAPKEEPPLVYETSQQEEVVLMWDAAPEQTPPIQGYFIYSGPESGKYSSKDRLPLVTEHTVYIPFEQTRYFTLSSFYEEGVQGNPGYVLHEGGMSNEIAVTAKPPCECPECPPPVDCPPCPECPDCPPCPECPPLPELSTSRPFMEIQTVMGATYLDPNDCKHLFNQLLSFYYPTLAPVSIKAKRRVLVK